MDTDDLSKELYQAIFVIAEKFHEDLTLQFSLLASHCDNEPDYIIKVEELINDMLKSPKQAIDTIFFENPPTKEKFVKVLQKITLNIQEVKQIPIEKRHFEF